MYVCGYVFDDKTKTPDWNDLILAWHSSPWQCVEAYWFWVQRSRSGSGLWLGYDVGRVGADLHLQRCMHIPSSLICDVSRSSVTFCRIKRRDYCIYALYVITNRIRKANELDVKNHLISQLIQGKHNNSLQTSYRLQWKFEDVPIKSIGIESEIVFASTVDNTGEYLGRAYIPATLVSADGLSLKGCCWCWWCWWWWWGGGGGGGGEDEAENGVIPRQ